MSTDSSYDGEGGDQTECTLGPDGGVEVLRVCETTGCGRTGERSPALGQRPSGTSGGCNVIPVSGDIVHEGSIGPLR